MIELEVVISTAFALLLGTVTWRVWQQRVDAQHQADANAEFVVLGRGMRAIADDLAKELAVLDPTLRSAIASDELQPSALDAMTRAVCGAQSLVNVLRGKPRDTAVPTSVEGVVRLVAALLRPTFPEISVTVDGQLSFVGRTVDAMRVVRNLILNVILGAPDGEHRQVRVHISDRALSITIEANEGVLLRNYSAEDRFTDNGSSGLSIVRTAAARLGWTLCRSVGSVALVIESPGVSITA